MGNSAYLTDKAFLPKTHLLRLEKGRFRLQGDLQYRPIPSWASWYEFKLVFDVSTFPPYEECTEYYNEMEVEFCSHAFPEKNDEGVVASSWARIIRTVKG